MKTWKRFVSMALAACMLLSLAPAQAAAAGETAVPKTSLDLKCSQYPHPQTMGRNVEWAIGNDAVWGFYQYWGYGYSGNDGAKFDAAALCAFEEDPAESETYYSTNQGQAYSYSSMSYRFVGSGTLSFDIKYECQVEDGGTAYDAVTLMTDGKVAYQHGGTKDWTTLTCTFTGEGEHTMCWTYHKDGFIDTGSDGLWVKNIQRSGDIEDLVGGPTLTYIYNGAEGTVAPESVGGVESVPEVGTATVTLPEAPQNVTYSLRVVSGATSEPVDPNAASVTVSLPARLEVTVNQREASNTYTYGIVYGGGGIMRNFEAGEIGTASNDPDHPWQAAWDEEIGEWVLSSTAAGVRPASSAITLTIPAGYHYFTFDINTHGSGNYSTLGDYDYEAWRLTQGYDGVTIEAEGALPSGYRSMGRSFGWDTKTFYFEDDTVPHTLTIRDDECETAWAWNGGAGEWAPYQNFMKLKNFRLSNEPEEGREILDAEKALGTITAAGGSYVNDGWFYDPDRQALASGNFFGLPETAESGEATLTLTLPADATVLCWEEDFHVSGSYEMTLEVDGENRTGIVSTYYHSGANLLEMNTGAIGVAPGASSWIRKECSLPSTGKEHTVKFILSHKTDYVPSYFSPNNDYACDSDGGEGHTRRLWYYECYWLRNLYAAKTELPTFVLKGADGKEIPIAEADKVGTSAYLLCPVGEGNSYSLVVTPAEAADVPHVTVNGAEIALEKVGDGYGFVLGAVTAPIQIEYYATHTGRAPSDTYTVQLTPDYSSTIKEDLAVEGIVSLDPVVTSEVSDKQVHRFAWIRNDKYQGPKTKEGDLGVAYTPTCQGYFKWPDAGICNLAITVSGPGTLSFDYFTSCCNGVNNAGYVTDSFFKKIGEAVDMWDWGDEYKIPLTNGPEDWQSCSIPVTANEGEETTIYVAFSKSGSYIAGDDTVGIANLRFEGTPTTLTVASPAEGTGSVSAVSGTKTLGIGTANSVLVGSLVTATAQPAEGYDFYGWKDGTGAVVSRELTYTFSVAGETTLVADFQLKGTYVARCGEIQYTNLEAAFGAAKVGTDPVVLLGDMTLEEDLTVPAGVTLLLPYAIADETGYALGTAEGTKLASFYGSNADTYRYRTLTIPADKTLTVQGKLIVGGVQHYPDQSAQGHTSGAYAQIVNNGSLVVESGGSLELRGLITGTGTTTLQAGGNAGLPFLVADFAGGTNTEALYSTGDFPFHQYATHNLQSTFTMEGGATLTGYSSLYFWGSVTTQDVALVGTDTGLIHLPAGSTLTATYDGAQAVKRTVGNIDLSDLGKTTLTIRGDAQAGGFDLYGFGSTTMVLDLPYTYDLVLESGTFTLAHQYRIMPGASVTVGKDATLAVTGAGGLQVMDGWVQPEKSGKRYPNAGELTGSGLSASGELTVNGALTVANGGLLAGAVQTTSAMTDRTKAPGEGGAPRLALTNGAVTDGSAEGYARWLAAGSEGGYANDKVTYSLTGRVAATADQVIPLTAGKTYYATSGETAWTLENYTMSTYPSGMDGAAQENPVTLNTPMTGTWASEVTVSFDLGGAPAGAVANPPAAQTGWPGEKITLPDLADWMDPSAPTDPTKTVAFFEHWYLSTDETKADVAGADKTFTLPYTDVTLTAKWDVLAGEYTLSFYPEEGATPTTVESPYSGDLTGKLPENPEKPGYRFDGWDLLDAGGTGDGAADTLPETMPAEDRSYRALWTSYLDLLNDLGSDFSDPDTLAEAREYYALLNDGQKTEYANWSSLESAIRTAGETGLRGLMEGKLPATNATLAPGGETIAVLTMGEGKDVYVKVHQRDKKALDMLDIPFLQELFNVGEVQSLGFPALSGKLYGTAGSTTDAEVCSVKENNSQFLIMFRTAWAAIDSEMTFTECYDLLYSQIDTLTLTALDGKSVEVVIRCVSPEGVEYQDTYMVHFYDKDHTVTFDPADGSGQSTVTYAEGDPITVPTPTRTGYTFLGWTAGEDTETLVTPETVMGRTDLSYTAKWSANAVTVTRHYHYPEAESETIDTVTVQYDDPWSSAFPESEPSKTGYAFQGWALTANGARLEGTEKIRPADAATAELHALWSNHISYPINYVLDGGAFPAGSAPWQSYSEDSAEYTLLTPAREGYTFLGWTGGTAGETATQTAVIPVGTTGELTFTAHWRINQYTLTYDLNGGEGSIPSVTADFGTPITRPEDPVREGWTFLGWDADGDGAYDAAKDLFPAAMPGKDLTLAAVWSKESYPWTVTAGEESTTRRIPYGETIALPEDPVRTGYAFTGWTILVGGVEVSKLPATMPASAVTLVAGFTPNSYTVTFAPGGEAVTGSMESMAFTYDAAQTLPACGFSKVGYTFVGWDADGDGSADYTDGAEVKNLTGVNHATVTLAAVWEAKTYTVTLVPGEGATVTPTTLTVTYGEPYGTLPTPETETGKRFDGWYLGGERIFPETVVKLTGDATLEARWSVAGDLPYKVKHYWQNVTGEGYTLHETTEHTDGSASGVTVPQQSYRGFHPAEGNPLTVTVEADGSTVVELRYDRELYTVTWNAMGTTGQDRVRYGAEPAHEKWEESWEDEHGEHFFAGWDKPIAPVEEDVTYTASYITAYEAVIVERGEHYATLALALENAQAGETVRLEEKTYTLGADLTVPAGVTLVLPCMDNDPGYVKYEGMEFNPNGGSETGTPSLYSSFTVPAGRTLRVEGRLLVNAVTGVARAGHYDQEITGGFAQVVLKGTIVAAEGGTVENFGSIAGSGVLRVENGGTVGDLYVVRNWRGGSQALKMYERDVYPMNEYDCKQITAAIELEYGSSLQGLVKMYAQDSYYYTRFPLVDNENGLVRLGNGSRLSRTVSDGSKTGREIYTLSGGAEFLSSTLPIVGVPLSTKDFVYPIDGDIDLVLQDGSYMVRNSYKLMPGATVRAVNAAVSVMDTAVGLSKIEPVAVVLYAEMEDPENQGTEYPSDRPAAKLYLDEESRLYVGGVFAGQVETESGSNIVYGDGAGYTATTYEANGYMNTAEGYIRALEHESAFTWGARSGWVEEDGESRSVVWSCGDGQHQWSESVRTEPTCTEEGYEEKTCRICGLTERESIPALGHDLEHVEAKEATETESGNVEHWSCRRCGKLYLDAAGTRETTLNGVTIPAKGSTEPVDPGPGGSIGGGIGGGVGSGSQPAKPAEPEEPKEGAVTVTKPDGSTEVAEVDPETVEAAKKSGEAVELPIEAVKPGQESATAPEVTVNLGVEGEIKVAIPVVESGSGIVAVVVYADGREEVVRKSVVTEAGLVLNTKDGERIKILYNAKSFSDVTESYWAAEAIDFASSHELLNGTGDGGFSPEMLTTRGMVAQVLNNLEDNIASQHQAGFPDVKEHIFEKAIDWASEEKIIEGSADGRFYPNAGISREQLVTMLYRYVGRPNTRGSLGEYQDAGSVSSWAKRAMEWAVESGVVSGTGSGLLAPESAASRAEVAVMLQRFCLYLARA